LVFKVFYPKVVKVLREATVEVTDHGVVRYVPSRQSDVGHCSGEAVDECFELFTRRKGDHVELARQVCHAHSVVGEV
jgi:hypothetical protein